MDMSIAFHVALFVLVVSTAFYPLSVLRRGVFVIPFLVSFSWVMFGGCVLESRQADGTRRNDMHRVLSAMGIGVTEATAKYIVYSTFVLLPTIVAGRALLGLPPRASMGSAN